MVRWSDGHFAQLAIWVGFGAPTSFGAYSGRRGGRLRRVNELPTARAVSGSLKHERAGRYENPLCGLQVSDVRLIAFAPVKCARMRN
jgi:hypothetical protein